MKTGIRIRTVGLSLAAMMLLATAANAQDPAEREAQQRATEAAVKDAIDQLAKTSFAEAPNVAVVPLRGDDADNYATEAVRAAITTAAPQYKLFTRDDETWNLLLEEIAWGDKRQDVMDQETIQKFGKVQGVDAILYGRVWDSGVNLWNVRGHTKLQLILADVETGQELWNSGAVEGEAYIHWSYAATRFWKYPMYLLGVIVGLIILLILFWQLKRVFRPL